MFYTVSLYHFVKCYVSQLKVIYQLRLEYMIIQEMRFKFIFTSQII